MRAQKVENGRSTEAGSVKGEGASRACDNRGEELPSAGVVPLQLDSANAQAWQGEQLLKLTPKAFAVLQYLLTHAGRLVTKEELLRVVWEEAVVTDGALAACIRELRATMILARHWRQYGKTEQTYSVLSAIYN